MSIAKYTLLHDMYEWLPPNGELETFVEESGLDVDMHVLHAENDGEKNNPYTIYVRTFSFSNAVYFKRQSLPGPYGYPFGEANWSGVSLFSGLGEVLNSITANDWNTHFGSSRFRHFILPFSDNNYSFVIIAKDWKLSEQKIVVDNVLTNSIYKNLAEKYGKTRALWAMTMQLQMPDEIKLD